MPITEILKKNARKYNDEIALVEDYREELELIIEGEH